jgi:hypothetical protein
MTDIPYDHGTILNSVLDNAPVPAINQILVVKASKSKWAGILVDELSFEDPETLPRVIEELDEILEKFER